MSAIGPRGMFSGTYGEWSKSEEGLSPKERKLRAIREQSQKHPEVWKAPVCTYFGSNYCSKGTDCHFRHEMEFKYKSKRKIKREERRDASRNLEMLQFRLDQIKRTQEIQRQEPVSSRPPCKFFVLGRCQKGNDCRFLHDPEEQQQHLIKKIQAASHKIRIAGDKYARQIEERNEALAEEREAIMDGYVCNVYRSGLGGSDERDMQIAEIEERQRRHEEDSLLEDKADRAMAKEAAAFYREQELIAMAMAEMGWDDEAAAQG